MGNQYIVFVVSVNVVLPPRTKMAEELTLEELKTMLETDTANVKALIFYSQCLVLKKVGTKVNKI